MPIGWARVHVDYRAWQHHHAVAGQTRSNTEIEAAIQRRERRVKSLERLKCCGVNEHAGFANGQNIAESVILRLVELPLCHRNALAKAGHGLTHFTNHQRTIGDPLLGARDANQRCAFNAEREVLECRAGGSGVIAQQPQPRLFGDGASRVENLSRIADCLGPAGAKGKDNILKGCLANDGVDLCAHGGVSRKIHHTDAISRPGLGHQAAKARF